MMLPHLVPLVGKKGPYSLPDVRARRAGVTNQPPRPRHATDALTGPQQFPHSLIHQRIVPVFIFLSFFRKDEKGGADQWKKLTPIPRPGERATDALTGPQQLPHPLIHQRIVPVFIFLSFFRKDEKGGADQWKKLTPIPKNVTPASNIN